MRIAIVSDVHANADALRAVLDDIDRRNVRAVVCLGDTVGYGAERRYGGDEEASNSNDGKIDNWS